MASLFVMMPLYYDGRFLALMGIERNLQLENFNRLRDFPANMVIINEQDDVVLSYPEEINTQKNKDRYLVDDNYFGYDDEFTQLVFKRRLTPSLLSVVYTTPLSSIYEKLKFQILNGAILNLISAIIIGLFTAAGAADIYAGRKQRHASGGARAVQPQNCGLRTGRDLHSAHTRRYGTAE